MNMTIKQEREREREREQNWWLTNQDRPPIPEPSQKDDNLDGGDDDNSNNPKCSKCGVNDAYHENLTIKIKTKETEETKVIWDKPLCKPCWKELVKCQICKAEQAEHLAKDGSNDVMLCEKCFRCSKCKTKQAVAQGVVDEDKNPRQILYQGSICETCYRELVKCEVCKVSSAVKPDLGIRKTSKS